MYNATAAVFSHADLDFILGTNTLLKGEAYQKKGWVSDLKISKGGEEITADVRGKTQSRYKVRIGIVDKPQATGASLNFSIQGTCSCYMSYNCKHVAATLLQVLNQQPRASTAESSISSNTEMLQSRFLSSPGAIKTPSTATSHWFSFLDNIKNNTQEIDPITAPSKQELIYILDLLTLPKQGVFLQVELQLVNILKKGGYGASKAYSLSSGNTTLLMPQDALIIQDIEKMRRSVKFSNYYYSENQYIIAKDMARALITSILKTNRCYWKKMSGFKLSLGMPLTGTFAWEFLGDGLQKLSCTLDNKTILETQPLWYIDNKIDQNTVMMGALGTEFDDETTLALIHTPALTPEEAQLFIKTYALENLPLPKVYVTHAQKGIPLPVLKLAPYMIHNIEGTRLEDASDDSAMAVFSFKYGATEVDFNNPASTIEYHEDNTIISVERDKEQELQYLTLLKEMQVVEVISAFTKCTFVIQLPFMFKDLPVLQAQKWIINIDPDFPFQCVQEEEWYTEVEDKSHYDWFGFELGILVGGQKINVLPLLVNLINKNPEMLNAKKIEELSDDYQFHLQLPDHRYVAIAAGRVKEILSVLVELYDSKALKNGILNVRYVQAAQLLGLQQSLQARWMGGEKLKKLGEKLLHFKGIESCVLPKGLEGQLRDYQKEGVDWLNFLREFQLGGILADDMGLGKTIQVLTHLLSEKESGRQKFPNLIIAPTSLMANWENECKRFTPDLKVLILQGAHRHARFENIAQADIVLSTYPLINRDKSIFLEHQFHYLILDEAQYIKNPYTKAYQVLLEVKAKHTLCMTGTPMENHLGELWSLCHFAIPGLLGDNKKFKKLFRDPIEKEGDVVRQKSLANRLKPFMLRRTKEQVATELPEKTEIIHSIELVGAQLDLYEGIRLAMQEKIVNAVKEKGFMRSQILILDALLKLRQTCNDPRLLPLAKGKAMHHSAKREFLMDMLSTLIEEGRKILLFSSFASMLDLIEIELIEKKISYVKLTGQTKDRTTPINAFQEGNTPVMLISLKAGGVGLNLTAADTVIHYDPWWNPAAEAQATDRAHRMGQTKPVFVYKLVCQGTVEEKILKMQENKKQLLQGIFKTGDSQSSKLSAKDLAYLFEPVEKI